jgi:heptosyltransferase-2
MKLPIVHFDCVYFHGDRPCKPNKQYSVFCPNCSLYEKDEEIKNEFPPIPEKYYETPADKFVKIIIIKLDAMGDVLRTTSLLPSIKKKYPDSDIYWITKERSFPVLKNNLLIDEIYFDNEDISHLFNEEFDIAINLDSGTESCSIMNNIIAGEKFGYELVNSKPYPVNELANEWYLMGIDDNFKKANQKTYHRLIHDICGLNYENTKPYLGTSSEIKKSVAEISRKTGLENFSSFYLVNLGGGNRWQYKKWTTEGYIGLINRLSENPENLVGMVAGNDDREFYNSIENHLVKRNNVVHFGCDNSVDDFISIILLSDRVFTSDSLAFHIATTLGKYVVVLTGPTSSTELDVFGNGRIITSNEVNCLCCYLNKCDKTVNCMNTISVSQVYEALTGGTRK